MTQRKQMYQKDIIDLQFNRPQDQRWGQAIVNTYNLVWPELFYERDEQKVAKLMVQYFIDNQISYQEI